MESQTSHSQTPTLEHTLEQTVVRTHTRGSARSSAKSLGGGQGLGGPSLSSVLGNETIGRMLVSGQSRSGFVPSALGSMGIQAKLQVSAADDPQEQEADRVADEVMRMPEPTHTLQRACASCEEESAHREADDLQRSAWSPVQISLNSPASLRRESDGDDAQREADDDDAQREADDDDAQREADDDDAQREADDDDAQREADDDAQRESDDDDAQRESDDDDAQRESDDDDAQRESDDDDAQREADDEDAQRDADEDDAQRDADDDDAQREADDEDAQRDADDEDAQRSAFSGLVQRRPAPFNHRAGFTADASIASRIQAARGGGAELDGASRAFLEPRFGFDFSPVRIHAGSEAAQLSRSIKAHAFTIGSDIFFGEGKYQPQSDSGRRLLSHELTHVVQQNSARLQRYVARQPFTLPPMASLRTGVGDGDSRHVAEPGRSGSRARTPSPAESADGDSEGAPGAGLDALELEPVSQASRSGSGVSIVHRVAEHDGHIARFSLDFAGDAIGQAIRSAAPELYDLVKQGPGALVKNALLKPLEAWVKGLLGKLNPGDAITKLLASTEGKEATGGDVNAQSCASFEKAIDGIKALAGLVTDNAAVKAVSSALSKLTSAAEKVASAVLSPVFDVIKGLVGGIAEGLSSIVKRISGWIDKVRGVLSAAADWVMKKLGLGGGDGIMSWLEKAAQKIWTSVKDVLAKAAGPLLSAAKVIVALSPLGPLLAVIKYGPQVVKAVQWLWANRGNPDIVKKAHAEMGGTFLPGLLSSGEKLGGFLRSAATWLGGQFRAAATSVLEVAGAVSGVPVLGIAQGVFKTLGEKLNAGLKWVDGKLAKGADLAKSLVAGIKKVVPPAAKVLLQVGGLLLNPLGLPGLLMGSVWKSIPDCYKKPLVDLFLDAAIGFVRKMPTLPIFGPLSSLMKPALLGFLEEVKASGDRIKVINKLIKVATGASASFIGGFLKGLLKGLWEGITDPFTTLWTLAEGVGKLVDWLQGLVKPAAVGIPAPAGAGATPPMSNAPASAGASTPVAGVPPSTGAAAEKGETIDRAGVGQEAQGFMAALKPGVAQVTGNLGPAAKEVVSGGGGGLTFEGLKTKLGEIWKSVEGALKGLGQSLAKALMGFFSKDTAEKDLGEGLGWLTGTVAFEVALAALTAGVANSAKAGAKTLQAVLKVLDWTGEVMGAAFKGIAKVGGMVKDLLLKAGKMLGNAGGGAVKAVMDGLKKIGDDLVAYAQKLLSKVEKKGAGKATKEALEDSAGRQAKKGMGEVSEAAADKVRKEAQEKGIKEVTEEAGEQGSKHVDEAVDVTEKKRVALEAWGAMKALEATGTPALVIVKSLDLTFKPRYPWIKHFEGGPGHAGKTLISMIASKTELGEVDQGNAEKFDGKLDESVKDIQAHYKDSPLGKKLGEGGNKDVFEIDGDNNKVIAILKEGKPTTALKQEIELLNQLQDAGLPTVNILGVTSHGGQPALVMDKLAHGSKDVVKVVKGKVKVVGSSEFLNEKSISDLKKIQSIMLDKKVKVDDLQFLIGRDGTVVLADPLDVIHDAPSPKNLKMIQLLIDAAKENIAKAGG